MVEGGDAGKCCLQRTGTECGVGAVGRPFGFEMFSRSFLVWRSGISSACVQPIKLHAKCWLIKLLRVMRVVYVLLKLSPTIIIARKAALKILRKSIIFEAGHVVSFILYFTR